jgi:hypothetical protein
MTMDGVGMHEQLMSFADPFGMAIVIGGAIATVVSFVLTFRKMIRPGETAPDHPKLQIFREDR